MANDEQVEILKRGAKAWNQWRQENPERNLDFRKATLKGFVLDNAELNLVNLDEVAFSEADLRNVDFSWASLRGAILSLADLGSATLDGADIISADLTGVDLRDATLYGTDLTNSNLTNVDLEGANLIGASLVGANLTGANLIQTNLDSTLMAGADFRHAIMQGTHIANIDLREVKNLNQVIHDGPSHIAIDTIYNSKGEIPHGFLRGAGVPENFITYMSSLTGKAFDYFSAFISYTEADDAISKRLYADLQAAGLRVWRWREDAKWGAPIEKNIDQAVRIYDKLIVICSEDSLKAPAVIDEIKRAMGKEHDLMKAGKEPDVLFPITIDDYIFDEWDHYIKPKVIDKTVGDFRGWEDPRKYDAALERLIAALSQEDSHSS